MPKIYAACIFILLFLKGSLLQAQLIENFNDGDFTTNPAWVGNTTDWVIDSANELRSNNTTANSSFYISTANTLATEAQWDLYIQLQLNTSSQNYVDVYLIASDSTLTNGATTGYFVRLGGAQDDISLFRKGPSANDTTRLIDGINGVLNTSNNKIRLRVTRNASNVWSLWRDVSGTGSSYFLEGTATDATYTTSNYFGFLVKQSTSSFFGKHYFDDIEIKTFVPDVTPPVLQSVTLTSGRTLDVMLSEPVSSTSAENTANYIVDNGVGNPASATKDPANPALVHLTFGTTFPNAVTNTITISNVEDLSGNVMPNATDTFTYFADVTPPSILSVSVVSPSALDISFSEPVGITSAENTSNYSVNNGIGSPASATVFLGNRTLVHLQFPTPFQSGITNTIVINNVTDTAGNSIANASADFTFVAPQVAQRFDVVIDELMPHPDPARSLPNAEYVEIRNVSNKTINLEGWRLSSSSTTGGMFGSVNLAPDSFLIITSSSNAAAFSQYGRVAAISPFPSLLNDGTTLYLVSKEGVTIHSVSYTSSWYQNPVKAQGGWSLEMIDPKNPCNGSNNWKAAEDTSGGTPGRKNSVDANNPDQIAPTLIRAAVSDSMRLLLTFSESLDSASAGNIANYSISGGGNAIAGATPAAPDFTKVIIQLASPLTYSTQYTVTVNNVTDCSGNLISSATANIGLPQPIDSFDIVINEILFDPKPNEYDYVELYNKSNKIVDLRNLYLASRSSSNEISALKQVTVESVLMFPGDYFVVSENPEVVMQRYNARNPGNFVKASPLPVFANDKGTVVLLNQVGKVVDELTYDAKWHFALLDNVEGVALERVDFDKPTQDPNNWHSAASTIGFGTPTYKNSQYKAEAAAVGEFTANPKIFSPDNDGFEDYTTINYQLTENGYVANITIFDAAGRPVRVLSRNATLGSKGSIRWDGLDDKQSKIPVGAYVIYSEIFNLNGRKRSFKTPVIVASRF